jgi:NADH-quinone oxidoreductase subunit N
MDLQTLSEIAKTNQWSAIFPEVMLGVLALGLLVMELLFPKRWHTLIPRIAILAQIGLLAGLVTCGSCSPFYGVEIFGGLLLQGSSTQIFRIFFLLTSILVCYLGMVALKKQSLPRIEFFHIVLVVTGAMMLLVQSNHFVMLFVALETITVGFYILVSYFRNNPLTLEAGLKYLILGGLSSAILLFGIALLYGAAGNPALAGSTTQSMHFPSLLLFLQSNPDNIIAIVGMLLVISGIGFKIGAVPFQIWIPDVYQGAPTPITAFLAVGSKAAGFGILLVLIHRVFVPLNSILLPILSVMTAATILFGNLTALNQRNTKRLMGLSGVSHAGYLLLGVVASVSVPWAQGAVLFYLFTYLLASMAVFSVMTHLASPEDSDLEIDHFADLAKQRPFLGVILAIGLGSMAGIPPLAGFIGKLFIFIAAFQAELYWLLGVAIVGIVLSIYYYFGWMKAAFFDSWKTPGHEAAPTPTAFPRITFYGKLTMVGLAVATVVLGFFQGPVTDWLINK